MLSVTGTVRPSGSGIAASGPASPKIDAGSNPAKGTKVIGTPDKGPTKIVPPTKAELSSLLASAGPEMRLRVMFAAATGLRASEQWALRWRHLDLVAGKVGVETRVDVHGTEEVTKSEAGTRSIPLAKSVTAALREWRTVSKHSGDDDLVFPNSPGGYTSHGNLLKRDFADLQTKAGTSLGWHALRHYAVSTWIEAGLAPKTVQTFAGHATLAITMDRYGHLFASPDHGAAMDRIAEQFDKV
jgi:integrase